MVPDMATLLLALYLSTALVFVACAWFVWRRKRDRSFALEFTALAVVLAGCSVAPL